MLNKLASVERNQFEFLETFLSTTTITNTTTGERKREREREGKSSLLTHRLKGGKPKAFVSQKLFIFVVDQFERQITENTQCSNDKVT